MIGLLLGFQDTFFETGTYLRMKQGFMNTYSGKTNIDHSAQREPGPMVHPVTLKFAVDFLSELKVLCLLSFLTPPSFFSIFLFTS